MKKIRTTFLLILLISIFSVGSVKASTVDINPTPTNTKDPLFTVHNAADNVNMPVHDLYYSLKGGKVIAEYTVDRAKL